MRLLILFILIAMIVPALGHDSWISKGSHRGKGQAADELCCGEGDCGMLDRGAVTILNGGYRVRGFATIEGSKDRFWVDELVPHSEAQPSPDGQYWHCHRPDKTRRCFFAPPQNM